MVTRENIIRLANEIYDDNIERMELRPGKWLLKTDLSLSRTLFKGLDESHLVQLDTEQVNNVLPKLRDALLSLQDRVGAERFEIIAADMEAKARRTAAEQLAVASTPCPRCKAQPTTGRKRDGSFKPCYACVQETKAGVVTSRRGRVSGRIAKNSVKV